MQVSVNMLPMAAPNSSNAGFVYVLINQSFPDMVKIGRTYDSSTERAVKLSRNTAVPTEFTVIYDELVADCVHVERGMHERFAKYRVNDRREFFRITPKEAIVALQELARTSPVTKDVESARIEILSQMEARCRRWLRRDLIGLAIIQFPDLVVLESAYQPEFRQVDIKIERTDMGFIVDDYDEREEIYFRPSLPIEVNARRMIDLDTYTVMACFDIFDVQVEHWLEELHKFGEPIPHSPPSPWI